MNKRLLSMALAGTVGFAEAAVVAKPVAYEIDGEAFEGTLVYDDAVTTPRPGLVMVPNWLGVTDRAAEKAARAASDKYVVFVADLYGKAVRPSNADEAKA
ncbi:dienelactone hydrolase family protein, partial [Stutzerimonas nitrititolerans]